MSAGDAAIELTALTKRYPGGVVALDEIDLTLSRGTITAIVGANGSGKSTLLRILAGDTRADSGTIRVPGHDRAPDGPALRSLTAYVAQAVELDPEITGEETLRLFATLHGTAPREIPARLERLAHTFGLREYLPRLVGGYSGGMRQRLHIALGFVHDRELVLLDEPTAALDPAGRADVWHTLQGFRDKGRTIVMITHDTVEASRHCDSIVLLHRGRVEAIGPPQELVTKHGSWVLEVRLACADGDKLALLERIDLSDLGTPRVLANRLTMHSRFIDAAAAIRMKDMVIERVENAGETVLGFRLDPPDLSSAYLMLTGAPITPSDRPVPRQRAGARSARIA